MPETKRVSVTDAPTAIHRATKQTVLVLRNPSATDPIDLGDENVVKGEGFELAAGRTEHFRLDSGETLYGIAPSLSTSVVHVFAGPE